MWSKEIAISQYPALVIHYFACLEILMCDFRIALKFSCSDFLRVECTEILRECFDNVLQWFRCALLCHSNAWFDYCWWIYWKILVYLLKKIAFYDNFLQDHIFRVNNLRCWSSFISVSLYQETGSLNTSVSRYFQFLNQIINISPP